MATPAAHGRALALRVARQQAGVATREQLYRAGVPRWLVRRELGVGRWRRTGRRTVALHNGPLPLAARQWVAVLEVGRRSALAGVTALQVGGVGVLNDTDLHVITPKGSAPPRVPGVVVHESRRWREEDVRRDAGVPRTVPAVSAVQAALWARTERQATYLLVVAVQQRVATVAQLAEVLERVRRHRFRRALLRALDELNGGVRSVGELDVALAMRERGLPEPDRQLLRVRASGRQYLDADFDAYGITLEVDGVQHDEPVHRLADLLRDLGLTTDGRTVVRLPLVVWRWDRAAVLDALEDLFRSRGWRRAA